MTTPESLSPPIIESDFEFLTEIKRDPKAKEFPPLLASSSEEAEKWIKTKSQLLAIVLNPEIKNPLGIPLIREAIKSQPTTPLFMISGDDFLPLSQDELGSLMVRKVLRKPMSYSKLLIAIEEVRKGFDAESALKIANKNTDTLGVEASVSDDSFVPILAKNFVSGGVCYFDVYVRINVAKYLKILRAGDAFTPDRLKAYLDKKVTHFYLRREAQEVYLKFCDRLTTVLLNRRDVSIETKSAVTFNQGQETLSFLKNSGVGEEALTHASKFAANAHTLLLGFRPEKHDQLQAFLKDLAAFEHGVSTTIIASMLLKPFHFGAEKSIQVVGVSSLLHDIGLMGESDKLKNEDEAAMTPEELIVYHAHPMKGARIVENLRGVDASVIQAIEQHHERRNREGFPSRIGAGALNKVAELISLAEEFSRLIERAAKDVHCNPFIEMQKTVLPSFSTPLVEIFQKVFIERNE